MLTNTYEYSALTHQGKVRKSNQDAFHVDTESKLIIVANGVGGYRGGDVASKLAVAAIKNNYRAMTEQSANEILSDCVSNATRLITMQAGISAGLEQMATTVVIGGIYPTIDSSGNSQDAMAVYWMGDSRAYLYRDGDLKQITTDHTVGNGHLTQAVGYNTGIDGGYVAVSIKPGDIFAFVTDGLYRDCHERDIINVLSVKGGIGNKTSKLIEQALAGGGNDNITVALVGCKPSLVKKYF